MKLAPEVVSAIAQEVVLDGYRGVEQSDYNRSWGQLAPREALNMERTVERVLHHFELEMARVPSKS